MTRLKRLARADELHGKRLEAALMASPAGLRTEALMALQQQRVRLDDFEIVRRMQYDPNGEARASCADALWIFGRLAEPLLLRLLEEKEATAHYDVAAAAARSLRLIGGEASVGPLQATVLPPLPGGPPSYRSEIAKDALLTVEARLGRVEARSRREGLWFQTPLEPNQSREPVASYWQLAREDKLHGDIFASLLAEAPNVWSRKQLLDALLEGETDIADLPFALIALKDPRVAVRGHLAGLLWRYGEASESSLIGLLAAPEFSVSGPASLALERIGTERSVPALRAQAMRETSALAISGRASDAQAAIQARMRTSI